MRHVIIYEAYKGSDYDVGYIIANIDFKTYILCKNIELSNFALLKLTKRYLK